MSKETTWWSARRREMVMKPDPKGTGKAPGKGPLVMAALLSLGLLGCGAKSFTVDQSPRRPLGEYARIECRELAIAVPDFEKLEPELQEEIRALAKSFPGYVTAKLAEKRLFISTSGRKLILEGRITQYDPGSRAARYLIGFGAGTGTAVAEITFADEESGAIGRGTATGGVAAGLGGGGMKNARSRLIDAVVRFIASNCPRE